MAFTLTVSEYARHRGCDEKAVRKQIALGRITVVGEGRERRIDPDVADIQWAKNTRARADSARKAPGGTADASPAATAAPAAAPAPQTPDYNDHRTRREKAEADMAELEAQQLAGKLVRREPVERAVMELLRVLRDACMASHQGTALKVLGLTDLREIRLALDDGYREAFADAERRIREWQQNLGAPT